MHTVTGKLNKPAREFDAGNSKGFSFALGQKYYDFKTKQQEWSNYKVVIFASNSKQIDFYRASLVEGTVVEVGAKAVKLDSYEGNQGTRHFMELVGAEIQGVYSNDGHQPQQQAGNNAYQQNNYTAQSQNSSASSQVPATQSSSEDFNDDIPF